MCGNLARKRVKSVNFEPKGVEEWEYGPSDIGKSGHSLREMIKSQIYLKMAPPPLPNQIPINKKPKTVPIKTEVH